MTRSCLVCGTPSTKSCSVCKTASYCDAEHQKKVRSKDDTQRQLFAPNSSLSPLRFLQDWRSHKEYCSKVKAAGANTFDAILFPVNETKPRLVKIPWKLNRGDEDDPGHFHELDTDIWFKHANKEVRSIYFHRLGINGPKLGRGLCFKYDENFMMNQLPLNRCIVEVTGGKAGHQWCGNILALRMESLYSYDFYASVDMEEDLKLFVTYFDEYNKVKPVH